jgi:hypothetical protein
VNFGVYTVDNWMIPVLETGSPSPASRSVRRWTPFWLAKQSLSDKNRASAATSSGENNPEKKTKPLTMKVSGFVSFIGPVYSMITP